MTSTAIASATPGSAAGHGGPAGAVTSLIMSVSLRTGGLTFLRTLFALARRMGWIAAPLYRLQFIHFLRWTLLTHVPDGQGGKRRLRPPLMFFEGDFDGNVFQYIDTFVHALPWRERAVWGMGRGFPGLHPVSRFVEWVQHQALPPGHEWFAYPEATTRMVGAGLRVEKALADFEAAVDGVDDDTFAAEFERLLSKVQHDL